MADYPTPERVRQLAEIRAYALAIDLDPAEITEIWVEDNPPYAPKMTFQIRDGEKVRHSGFHTLTEEQRAAVTNAGDAAERLWSDIHEVQAFQPKEWRAKSPASDVGNR